MASASVDDWAFKGPQPTGPDLIATSGRVTALAVDPRDPNTVFLGAANGGVWKTSDGGEEWMPLTDDQPSMVIGSIALDPSNPDTVYVGTGEANACRFCFTGFGILKSMDGGLTWQHLPGSFIDQQGRGARIPSIAVHPTDGNIVLAATFFVGAQGLPGIYRSTDGGENWTPVLNVQQGTAVLFDPDNPEVAYAALFGTGVFKSTDAGLNWEALNGTGDQVLPVANAGRINIAQAASQPDTLFAAITSTDPASEDGLVGLFKTVDGGENWSRLDEAPDYCHPQCSFSNTIKVDPNDANVVFAGGIHLHRSMDGGENWGIVNRGDNAVFLHSDQLALAFASGNSALYVGNGGGVFKTNSRTAPTVSWFNLNSTLGITQFFSGLSIHPVDLDFSFGGTQGNGTQRYIGSIQWDQVACNNGGQTAMDPVRPLTVYTSCQQTEIWKSTDGGKVWTPAMDGLERSERVQTVPPLVHDPSQPQRLYFGTFRVYQSTDGAGSWTPISPDLAGEDSTITSIAVAPSNPEVVYVGTSNGRIHVTLNATGQTLTFWEEHSAGLSGRPISHIVVHPDDAFFAFAATSGFAEEDNPGGHIFGTTDSGVNWTDISGNLPNLPINNLVVDPDIPGTLYAATDVSVFQTEDGGTLWLPLGNGLPRVSVQGLTLHRVTRTLRAATHGRGVWDLPVPLPDGLNPIPGLLALSPSEAMPGSSSLSVTVDGVGFVPGAVVLWNRAERLTTFVSSTQVTATLNASDLESPSIGEISVLNPSPGGGISNTLIFPVTRIPTVNSSGTVNAASFDSQPVAAGSLASTFGANLSISTVLAGALPLPHSLGDTVLTLASQFVPLLAVSPQQINFQVPWELEGLDSAIVQVSVAGVDGTIQSVRLAEYSPGIFTLNQSGSGQGAVLIANSAIFAAPENSLPEARPAMRGEIISIFCTGLGAVSNPPPTGSPAPAEPLSVTETFPTVTIGDGPAPGAFASLAPGFVGLYQINVEIPQDAPTGDSVPLTITIGGVQSNTVTIAVQ